MSTGDRPDQVRTGEQGRIQHERARAVRVRAELAHAHQLLRHAREEAQGASGPGALIQAVEHLAVAVDDLAAVVGIPPALEQGDDAARRGR